MRNVHLPILMFALLAACSPRTGDGKCVEATRVVDADLKKLVDDMPYEAFDAEELGRKAKGIMGTGENTCTRERAPNKAFQVDIMKRMLKTATDAIDAEKAARKKDPNIDKRGPKPRSNNFIAGNSVDMANDAVKARMKNPSAFIHVATVGPLGEGPRWMVKVVFEGKSAGKSEAFVYIQNGKVVEVKGL